MQLDIADIEWQKAWHVGHDAGKEYRFRNRIARNQVILEELGDQRGATVFREDGERKTPVEFRPHRYLAGQDEVWSYFEDKLIASVRPAGSGAPIADIRTLGFAPAPRLEVSLSHGISFDELVNGPAEFCVLDSEDGTSVVLARSRNEPDLIFRWVLKEELGLQPIRVEAVYKDAITQSLSIHYAPVDGEYMFPDWAEYRDANGAKEISIRVTNTRVNDPALPETFDPRDIGLANGVNVEFGPTHPNYGALAIFYEDRAIPSDEYLDLLVTVGVEPGPVILRANPALQEQYERVRARNAAAQRASAADSAAPTGTATQPASQPARASQAIGLWEAYTLAFIDRYRLADEQRQKAMTILADCQRIGWAYLTSIQGKLDELDRQAGEPNVTRGAAGRPPSPSDAARTATVNAERARLLKPLDAIFEQQLKPRLDRLPTRAQRAAAEASPASQPIAP